MDVRLLRNGAPCFHAGLLDPGYWPDGQYAALSDQALAYDIAAAQDLGFTMLRKHIKHKHIKVEPLRWCYHCDRLSVLVWQDLVSGGRSYRRSVADAPAVGVPHPDDSDYAVFGRGDGQGRTDFRAELEGHR